jgi:hypothetical protein
MPKIELDKTAQAGHVLFRYMRAGHRFKNKVEHRCRRMNWPN